jgi:hypothetical protein
MENVSLIDSNNLEDTSEYGAHEDDLTKMISALHNEANAHISQSNFKNASVYLKKCEEILETLMTQGVEIHHGQVLVTLHNLALCFQQLNDLNKTSAYIEACIYNVLSFNVFSKDLIEIHSKLKKFEYVAKIHIQSSAVLSKLQNHKLSLVHARKAMDSAKSLIKFTLKIASVYTSKYIKSKKLGKPLPQSTRQFVSIINLASPALKSLENFMKKGVVSDFNTIPSVLGVVELPDWISKASLSDFILMQPITLEDLEGSIGLQNEYTKDCILMKICVLGISFFLVSTELDCLQLEPAEAENFHDKAIKLLSGFLPEAVPLIQNLKEIYEKRYNKTIEYTPDYLQPSIDVPVVFIGPISKLPKLNDRPISLSPVYNLKNSKRRASERPKTVTNLESVYKLPDKNKTPTGNKQKILKFKKKFN